MVALNNCSNQSPANKGFLIATGLNKVAVLGMNMNYAEFFRFIKAFS
jgi:hypothetical protein